MTRKALSLVVLLLAAFTFSISQISAQAGTPGIAASALEQTAESTVERTLSLFSRLAEARQESMLSLVEH